MSRGMLHRYFASKNELLAATAENASEFYYDVISKSLHDAGEKPYAKLQAIIAADLGPELLNRESVVLWNALRSVAHSDAHVREFSSTRDESLQSTLREIYEELLGVSLKEPEISGDLANGTIALLEGMWADYFLYPDRFNREKAISIVMRFIDGQLK